jgi:predicted small secreted protein
MGEIFMRIFILTGLFIATVLGLSGCNTIQGIGADLETAGKTMQSI